MKKRFTDTDIWDDPWYRKMPGKYKLFWKFICDKCDNAGVWKIDAEVASFYLGEKIDIETAQKVFNERKERVFIAEDKLVIKQFISFQIGEHPLLPASPPQKSILSCLSKNHLEYCYPNTTLRLGLAYGNLRPQDKDKDKERYKDKDEDEDRGEAATREVREEKKKLSTSYKQKILFLDCVLLLPEEREKLIARFGESETNRKIEKLNDYIQAKGKKYKSHYHTILMWADKDGVVPSVIAAPSGIDAWAKKEEAKIG